MVEGFSSVVVGESAEEANTALRECRVGAEVEVEIEMVVEAEVGFVTLKTRVI